MRETSRNYSPSDCWTGTWKPQVQVPVCIRQKEFHCGASISFHMSASSIAILRIALFLCFTSRKKMFQSPLFFFNMEWTDISKSPTSFFSLNLNSHFSTSSTITWSILYFTANLTHVINRVSSYRMNYLYEGSESQNIASFLHEYFCASRLSHTSSHIWLLSDWEQRPWVAAPIGASSLPLFFSEPRGHKNMTLLYQECFNTHFVSALSLCLRGHKEDGEICSFLMSLLMGKVSPGTSPTSAWTSCYGLYRCYVETETVSGIAFTFSTISMDY